MKKTLFFVVLVISNMLVFGQKNVRIEAQKVLGDSYVLALDYTETIGRLIGEKKISPMRKSIKMLIEDRVLFADLYIFNIYGKTVIFSVMNQDLDVVLLRDMPYFVTTRYTATSMIAKDIRDPQLLRDVILHINNDIPQKLCEIEIKKIDPGVLFTDFFISIEEDKLFLCHAPILLTYFLLLSASSILPVPISIIFLFLL